MNRPQQGQRIVVLVRALVGLGLLMVGITIGLVGWTLARVRVERGRATAEQAQLNLVSDQFRQGAAESRTEIQIPLDETIPHTNRLRAVSGFINLIAEQSDQRRNPAVQAAIDHFVELTILLTVLSERAEEWRANYDPLWRDVSQQRTLGQVRALITQLRSAVETMESRRRLDDAIKHRRWRTATNDASGQFARAILEEQGRVQSQGVNDFKSELAECARLVEMLGGEEQIDSLADLKDNKLKPVLDRLGRDITEFSSISTNAGALVPRSVEQLKTALFGTGPDGGGLFTLRKEVLRLRRDREGLKSEIAALFHDIEKANADFAQSAQARTAALTQQMEGSLAAGWKQMLYVGGGCSALFLWLAWMISRGIGGQVNALDRARAEAVQENAERRQAEEALRKSEAQLQTVVENLGEGVAVADLNGRILHFNQAALKMHGFTHVEESCRRLNEFADLFMLSEMSGAKIPIERWPLSRILRGESLRNLDVRVHRPDEGWERVFSYGGTLVHDADGRSLMAVVTIADITERKRAEEKLNESLRSLAAINAVLDRACIIAATDQRGLITHANDNLCKISEYSREELLGQNHRLLKSGQHADSFFAEMWRTIANGEVWRGEIKNRTKSGGTYWVDTTIGPLLDEEGKPKGYLAIRTDITERKKADGERARLVDFLEASLNEVYVFDPESLRFSYVNRSARQNLGYTTEQIAKLTPVDIKPEFTEESFRKALAPLLAGTVPKHLFQTIHRRADGTNYPVEVCLQLVATGTERVLLAVINDITERKRAEAELSRTQKELLTTSRMAGMAEVATGVLHNVGNVLNSVNVSATVVADKVKKSRGANLARVVTMLREHEADIGAFLTTDAKGKQIPAFLGTLADHLGTEQAALLQELASLQKNIEHIKDVVAMQQTYAKVSGVTETVSVSELLEDTLRLNASSLMRHDIEVVREFAEVPPVTVDKHKLLQILVNLVRNAKHACDDSGRTDKRITLRVAGDAERVRISVSDNGVGIPPENLNRIFNHGFTTKKDGHGFGLHSGANAAKELGGSLTVHSEGAGRGATFTIELPLQPGARNSTPITSPPTLAA